MTTTQTTGRNMTDAFRTAERDVAALADWIEFELGSQSGGKVTRSRLNTLERVRENLIGTLALFSGVETDEVRRSLEELDS